MKGHFVKLLEWLMPQMTHDERRFLIYQRCLLMIRSPSGKCHHDDKWIRVANYPGLLEWCNGSEVEGMEFDLFECGALVNKSWEKLNVSEIMGQLNFSEVRRLENKFWEEKPVFPKFQFLENSQ